MEDDRLGQIAVIFVSQRRSTSVDADDTGYSAAATAMHALATRQPGYRGLHSVRGTDGGGVTISYWADDAAAIRWRDHPEHRAIRARGRREWYDTYQVVVARVERGYSWSAA